MPERPDSSGALTAKASSDEAPRWHYLRFRWFPGNDGLVASHLDLAVAAEVVGPLVEDHAADLTLWRFHRRWPADEVGHQFSWIVFAAPETVARLDRSIRAHPVTRSLAAEDRLRSFHVDAPAGQKGAAVGATSDPAWPASVRDAWPAYIQGVSRMWLGLVREAAAETSGDLDTRYREAEAKVGQLWYEQADHAMLHHLNALFGYRPLRVRGQGEMRF